MFRALVARLLGDPAVSGIALGEHWDHIQLPVASYPYEPHDGYDWSFLKDVFTVADHVKKPVQLLITPGVDSPPALLDAIPSCNALFKSGGPPLPTHCGTVVFPNEPEAIHSDGDVLPLPWNARYNNAWHAFLRRLNGRYERNREFSSIAIAGPVDGSPEMILPTSANTHHTNVDGMWARLISYSFPHRTAYQNTDEVFVDQWDTTIDFYENLFAGVTLLLTPDSGGDLPDFSHQVMRHRGNDLYTRDCAASIAETDTHNPLYTDLMSCEAKTEILSHLVRAQGPNGKATRDGGMAAASATTLSAGDIGVPGIKLLTTLFPAGIVVSAGADFDFPVSASKKKKHEEGCPTRKQNCGPLTVDDAAANVLKVFFDYTPDGAAFGGTDGNGHVEFLGVPYLDVLYAEHHSCAALQALLDKASQALTGQAVNCVP